MLDDRIIAVGLLTAGDLERLGASFSRVWPLEDAPEFAGLLQAIDEAERKLGRSAAPGEVS